MTIGSVATDDSDAAMVVEILRRDAGIQQAGELKFGHFAGRSGAQRRRFDVLTATLRSGGALR
ncbi:hypothetical protein AB0873_28925 [Micromonospora sp. NPDC047707]|uniref:hypothetical protein n=1 Tax=Micromonospora sp. NPDC047707 TaxID=3154498 RepID=UPI0034565F36